MAKERNLHSKRELQPCSLLDELFELFVLASAVATRSPLLLFVLGNLGSSGSNPIYMRGVIFLDENSTRISRF